MKQLYAFLALLGFVLPYLFFLRFLAAYGLDLQLFIRQLTANDISTFFAVDLFLATIVFWVFVFQESRKRPIRRWWICVIASLLAGLSCALPLFLYLREVATERRGYTIGELDD